MLVTRELAVQASLSTFSRVHGTRFHQKTARRRFASSKTSAVCGTTYNSSLIGVSVSNLPSLHRCSLAALSVLSVAMTVCNVQSPAETDTPA